ncbi:hypothetical protein ACRALDRAFT_2037704 [Sodiomyces alcalophilus JCM 7366]|uniref:uncharacterized protein n=1 Tax=Sodiomyces alcalophilus JCM 7366 TaxID=591952 RepID=UPI0039B3B826
MCLKMFVALALWHQRDGQSEGRRRWMMVSARIGGRALGFVDQLRDRIAEPAHIIQLWGLDKKWDGKKIQARQDAVKGIESPRVKLARSGASVDSSLPDVGTYLGTSFV